MRKRRPGRPNEAPDGKPRALILRVRISEAERERLGDLAAREGLSLSELIRQRLGLRDGPT